ncbi:MAG TPA: GNAT family N-acetyltransferase [Planctomycetota bacterium]|nr:GNAT family N-acetyltransferase [Planctomycetota bacterium]
MIRPFRPTDRDALVEITAKAFDGVSVDQNLEARYGLIHGVRWQERKASHIDADIMVNPGGILVWEDNGRVAGFVTSRFDRRTRIGSIPNLAVHPDHQGKGIGKQLLEAGIAHLRSLGMKFVRIETLEQNPRCVTLYPRMGFCEIARQIHYVLPLQEEGGGEP